MTDNRNKLIERRSVSLFLFKIKRVTIICSFQLLLLTLLRKYTYYNKV